MKVPGRTTNFNRSHPFATLRTPKNGFQVNIGLDYVEGVKRPCEQAPFTLWRANEQLARVVSGANKKQLWVPRNLGWERHLTEPVLPSGVLPSGGSTGRGMAFGWLLRCRQVARPNGHCALLPTRYNTEKQTSMAREVGQHDMI
ncbi:hypothetical protein VDGL01_05478 [Verticillium dahliae]